jgi:hypothetical protein
VGAVSSDSETRTRREEPRTARSDEGRATGSYDTFYEKLDRYGDWRETSDYGYVFQPREAQQSRTWRPYTDGHWAYTDAGWTWISEEPFGWATYHYGRWTRLRNVGWVWVPGDEWAPAWVSWRKGDEYVGWAPLPPEARFDRRTGIHNWSDNYYDIGPEQYCFVETRQFGGQHAQRAVIAPERNVTIVNQTTNVTNITYSNTTVINQGPSYDDLRTRTQEPIARLRLERQTNVDVNAGEPRSVVRGEAVFIPAPLIARGQAVERPRTVKETIANVVVERGWEISDRNAAEQARKKMRAEATPPPNAPSKTFVKPTQASAAAATATAIATPTPSVAPAIAPAATTTPMASATPAPSMTPAAPPPRHANPRITPAATATAAARATATPMAAATPTPAATATVTGSPTFASPRPAKKLAPLPTATATAPSASVSPSTTTSTSSSPAFGQPGDARGRKAEKQLRKQERRAPIERQNAPSGAATASPSATIAPSAPPAASSPAGAAAPSTEAQTSKKEQRQIRKEEKKDRRQQRGAEQSPAASTTTPTPTPSP